MLRVGLTGGMCCGKSTVGEMFRKLGARVILADQIAHELMRPGTRVYDEIVRHFGRAILNEDGTVSRPQLAQAAFATGANGSTRIAELNEIVHPEVLKQQEEWMDEIEEREPEAIAIVEAALIFEAGADSQFDKVVVVTCRPEQKAERFAARAGVDIEAAKREIEIRSAAQLPDQDKIRRADYIVDNAGSVQDTEQQVAAIYQKLKKHAQADR